MSSNDAGTAPRGVGSINLRKKGAASSWNFLDFTTRYIHFHYSHLSTLEYWSELPRGLSYTTYSLESWASSSIICKISILSLPDHTGSRGSFFRARRLLIDRAGLSPKTVTNWRPSRTTDSTKFANLTVNRGSTVSKLELFMHHVVRGKRVGSKGSITIE